MKTFKRLHEQLQAIAPFPSFTDAQLADLNITDLSKPLYEPFNTICIQMAHRYFPQGYDVAAQAPDSFQALVSQITDKHRMLVWNGGSVGTIFGPDPQANYAFRAWHDYDHFRANGAFTEAGEEKAFEEMMYDVRSFYGYTLDADISVGLLHEEILGQLEYNERHNGNFPVDQRAFAVAYLKDPEAAVRADFGASPVS